MHPSSLLLPDAPGLIAELRAAGLLDQLSDGAAESAYARAYLLTQQRQYLQASRLFALLSLFRPTQLRVWQGLAVCARELKAHDDAVRALRHCVELAPQAPEFSFALADCLCLGGHPHQAIEWLEAMVSGATGPGAEPVAQRARDVIARLQGALHEPQH